MVEFVLVSIVVAVVAYFVYKMVTHKELLDFNKDGKVNATDANVVVEKIKKNVKKGTTKVAAKAEKNVKKAVNKTAPKRVK